MGNSCSYSLMSFIGIFTAIFIGISGEITHYNQK